ncbi:MAG: hypothetical protein ACE5GS_12505 [Kiloniellaceae bacterium]
MVHQSTKIRVFEKLAASLQSAARGSRELDIIVSFVLGETSSDAGKMIQLLVEEGYPWDVVSELLDEDLPSYTSSLDAAVPGENIVLAAYSPKRGKWVAVHKTGKGAHVLVWAATECLARRLAALKALRPDLRPAQAAAGAPAAPGPAPEDVRAPANWREAHQAGRDEAGHEAEEEWKILF